MIEARSLGNSSAPFVADRICMRWPLFSMRKRSDFNEVFYRGEEASFRVSPSAKGVPTVWDRDVIIYITSRLKVLEAPSRTLQLCAHDFLKATRRSTGVQGYQSLMNALFRLKHSRVTTNIGRLANPATVSWIDDYSVNRRTHASGKTVMASLEVTLSEWAFHILLSDEVAPINPNYFSLTGGLERRIYELVLHCCGEGSTWTVPLRTLATDSGSTQCNLRRFKFDLKAIIAKRSLPGMSIDLFETGSDCIVRFARAPLPSLQTYQA